VATLASDAERERCARALRDHAAAGRLTVAELESRLERAYAARYRWELRSALSDLPSDVGRRVACLVDRLDRLFLRAHLASFAFATLLTVGLWFVSGEGAFWPALLIAPWGVLLASHVGGSWGVRRMLRGAPRRRRLAA
jgi:hypothetical protein